MSTLDLSFNRLTEIRRYGLTSVGRLDVSYNTVEKIADDALAGLHHSLAELDLGYNRLAHVSAAVLRNARSLLLLDLRHNYLGPKFGVYSPPSSSADPGDLTSFNAPSTGNLFQVPEHLNYAGSLICGGVSRYGDSNYNLLYVCCYTGWLKIKCLTGQNAIS